MQQVRTVSTIAQSHLKLSCTLHEIRSAPDIVWETVDRAERLILRTGSYSLLLDLTRSGQTSDRLPGAEREGLPTTHPECGNRGQDCASISALPYIRQSRINNRSVRVGKISSAVVDLVTGIAVECLDGF
jgi:hypothetical protein